MLEIQELTKRYQRKAAIDQVSFSLRKGEIFGLLGPNGAGKTTLIRIINKIIEQDSGTIRFNGDLLQQKHLAHIGYLPEERGLYKQMTVEAHAHFLGALRGMSKSEINTSLDYWLKKFHCADWRKRRIQELSKGMAQKVQFIVTVMHQPKLLILDEPFSGFDPINAQLIAKEILQLRDEGATIIFSTHRMESVEELCDDIALIHKSNKILDGKLIDIKRKFRSNVYQIGVSTENKEAVSSLLHQNFEVLPADFKLFGDEFICNVKLSKNQSSNDLLSVLSNDFPN
mgnify:CR=1 FL=1